MIQVFVAAMVIGSGSGNWELFSDKGDVFVRAGKNQGLKRGAEVELLGEPIGDTSERRVVGKANVMEVYDTIARIVPDEGAKAAKPKAARLAVAQAQAEAAAPAPAAHHEGGGCPEPRGDVKPVETAWEFANGKTGPKHVSGKCCGVKIDLYTISNGWDWDAKLLLNDEVAEQKEVGTGVSVLHGTAGGKRVEAKLDLGQLTAAYDLKIDGKACQVTAL